MKIERLRKQQAELAAQIARAEQIEKNRVRVEKLVFKVLSKHPNIFLADTKNIEEVLTEYFSVVSEKLSVK